MVALRGLRQLESDIAALEKKLAYSRPKQIHVIETHQDNRASVEKLHMAMFEDGRASAGDIFIHVLHWGDDPIIEARLLYSKESL